MKIVYFIDHLRPDGTQRVLQQLVEGLTALGHQQTVVCLNNSVDQTLIKSLQGFDVPTRIIGKHGLLAGYGLLATWQWMRREQIDVVVTFLFAADVLGRTLAKTAGVGHIISSLRARNTHYTPWQRWLVRKTMPWADAIVLNSATVRDFATSAEGARHERIHVIPNGVTIDAYREPMSRAELRAELGLAPDHCLIGSVGRLHHQKGLDVLVQALASVPHSDIDLVLIGEGEEETRLQTQATALGLDERIHFMGYRRDVPRILGALDLYVHPARFEGMPNALLEAMAAGCPIVASAVDGNRELIEDGVHGWLVAPEDAGALAEAIQVALNDPLESQRRAANATDRIATNFSVGAMVASWEQILCDQQ